MATTPNYALPYPSENDVPNGAAQIGALATAVDGRLLIAAKFPICQVVASLPQSIPNAAYTAIKMNIEDIDTHGYHSTATVTDRVIPKIPGLYRITGTMAWSANGNGTRRVAIGKNGGQNCFVAHSADSYIIAQQVSKTFRCNGSGDYFSVFGYQTSGGALASIISGSFQPMLEVKYLRPL